MPRAFSSHDDLISYATSLAADQSALDQRLNDTHAQFDASAGQRDTLSVQLLSIIKTQQQLFAAGALTAPQTAWRRPTEGEITQPFGPTTVWVEPARTYQGVVYKHFHDGVDIAGPGWPTSSRPLAVASRSSAG